MKELEYPFDAALLLRKRRALKKELLQNEGLIKKNIAILGGSTTHDVKDMMELFLLNYGILPAFYESEYAQYWQDAMFENKALEQFHPDIIYIHTTSRNITSWPEPSDSFDGVNLKIEEQFCHYETMWEKLKSQYNCPIVQNNFEYLPFRIMGNRDASDFHGRVNFISRLNLKFYDYAMSNENFFINDINYQAASFGLEKWSDPQSWYLYKYALSVEAIPDAAFNISNVIKSILGKNKKALALDLDNTLWGGVVGDDGVDNLELGQETAVGQAFCEFQQYLKELQKYGILLNVISKNDYENAISGIEHPQMILKKDDFVSIKANWEPKSVNLLDMASELSLLPDSFVFVDDNPAERELIRQQVRAVAVPELSQVEKYISAIDKAGYFEISALSQDDLSRSKMYLENVKRTELLNKFENYNDYLISLDMTAEIGPFDSVYYSRIAQLTNKSNQFNLTTLRCTQNEIRDMREDSDYITLFGKLSDKFGDNGVVSVVVGKKTGEELSIILWLMSCRVLKRGMEYAMEDVLVETALKENIKRIIGVYYPTAKNAMVKNFYNDLGFCKVKEDSIGSSTWELDLSSEYTKRNNIISVLT